MRVDCGARRSEARWNQKTCVPAHAAPLLCHTPSGKWDRSVHHPDVAGTRGPGNHIRLPARLPPSFAGRRQSGGNYFDCQTRYGEAVQKESETMTRPAVEVADILRAQGSNFMDRYRNGIRFQQLKVMRAIVRCRTAALGGHIDKCLQCGKDWGLSFNSCRNRHCPKCQAQSRQRWIAARQEELLATSYFHVVFTLPHLLNTLIRQNPVELYNLLFRSVAETLMEVAANPKHLGAEIGFFAILHTWSQNLLFHPHIHCVVPSGGLAPGRTRWIRGSATFFLPLEVLQQVF